MKNSTIYDINIQNYWYTRSFVASSINFNRFWVFTVQTGYATLLWRKTHVTQKMPYTCKLVTYYRLITKDSNS